NIQFDLTPREIEHLERFLEMPSSALLRLGESQQRNALIISEIARLNDEGYTVIIFACSVEHARMLADLCRIRGIMARSIDGETAEQDRRLWLKQYKRGDFRTLINFGVLTTGFDAPNTNAILITRPTASLVLYSQMIGRGIRGERMGGNEECLLVDIEDNLRDFPSESQAFNHFKWS
ncbi:TPA: restriction endonuclease, partial [Candidatus Poribacteria bacterium]|nr:restriction endonuclease [Candidatus Poribacteria bacterium]